METRRQFVHFMASPAGRGVRVMGGLALIGWDLSIGKVSVAVLGTVPLLGESCRGEDIRRAHPARAPA